MPPKRSKKNKYISLPNSESSVPLHSELESCECIYESTHSMPICQSDIRKIEKRSGKINCATSVFFFIFCSVRFFSVPMYSFIIINIIIILSYDYVLYTCLFWNRFLAINRIISIAEQSGIEKPRRWQKRQAKMSNDNRFSSFGPS